MNKPEELANISSALFEELLNLKFTNLRNSEVIINDDENESITSYYYSDYGVTGIAKLGYNENPTIKVWAEEMKKANDAFAEVIIPENELEAWIQYREDIGYLPDPKLNKAKAVYYYSYSIGLGALSISSFKPITKKQIKILERFRNVFHLSYQRYVDIELAVAQTKEAQMEAALERIRSKTMAMQKSDELADVSKLIFDQLRELGGELEVSGVVLCDREVPQHWMSAPGVGMLPPINIPQDLNPQLQRLYLCLGE